MKILHPVPAYYPSQGGIETLVRSLVRRSDPASVITRLFAATRRLLDRIKPQLLHSHGITLLTVPLAILARRKGIPVL